MLCFLLLIVGKFVAHTRSINMLSRVYADFNLKRFNRECSRQKLCGNKAGAQSAQSAQIVYRTISETEENIQLIKGTKLHKNCNTFKYGTPGNDVKISPVGFAVSARSFSNVQRNAQRCTLKLIPERGGKPFVFCKKNRDCRVKFPGFLVYNQLLKIKHIPV